MVYLLITNDCIYFKDPVESTWTLAEKVGDLNVPEFDGRKVVLADETLNEFGNFLDNFIFDFEYDHAVGVFR